MRPWLLLLPLLVACHAPAGTLPPELARLAGRDAWVYGGGPLRCVRGNGTTEYTVPLSTPVRVTQVEQTGPREVEIGVKGHVREQRTPQAIILTLEPQDPVEPISGSSGNGPLPRWWQGLEVKSCTTFRVAFVDETHLNRTLSFTPPPGDVQRLSSQPRASSVGLSATQLLWLRGPPDEPLTDVETLRRAPTWTVIGGVPYGDQVTTFHNGRVVRETFPGMGP
ncbi:hypothetical protein [Deinococcus soli (ex Cha et al. 2016)]|uniref:Lipoprotein n=1 Tax=Deinococcus soli (ex Cha et al. 2016) TaxID=1309411 RepID=A0A0F7JNA4_9DEIO|nr:hypothetical protein [Deinococcus soli (ex Cha et al. 2016)]AKH16348.1 hypothetical protein SY84_04000 [Deinococcus soli (ex Cha et al. 2016)]